MCCKLGRLCSPVIAIFQKIEKMIQKIFSISLLLIIPNLLPAQKTWSKQFDYEPEMVFVEGGSFTMGCTGEQGSDCFDSEKPNHKVTLSGEAYPVGYKKIG